MHRSRRALLRPQPRESLALSPGGTSQQLARRVRLLADNRDSGGLPMADQAVVARVASSLERSADPPRV